MTYKTLIRKEDNQFMCFDDEMIYEVEIPRLFKDENTYNNLVNYWKTYGSFPINYDFTLYDLVEFEGNLKL